MDILILNWKDIYAPDKGGAEILAHNIAEKLSNHNKVTFFTSDYKNSEHATNKNHYKIIRKGNKLSCLFHAYIYYKKLEKKPTLIIEFYNVINWFSFIYRDKKNTKILSLINQLTQEIYFYEFNPLLATIGFLAEKIQFYIYRFFSNQKFICYSESTVRDLNNFGIDKKNIFKFNLGVNLTDYFLSPKTIHPSFICINRIVSNKRTDLVVKAFKKITSLYNESKLYIFGQGRELNNLKKLVKNLNLHNNIEFIDDNFSQNFINTNIINKKLSESWALILLSVKEGWGLVVTEAAASGTTSILSKVSGLVDSGKDKHTSIYVSVKPTINEIFESMKLIILDPKLRKNLSNNAFKNSQKYSNIKSLDEFNKIILDNYNL